MYFRCLLHLSGEVYGRFQKFELTLWSITLVVYDSGLNFLINLQWPESVPKCSSIIDKHLTVPRYDQILEIIIASVLNLWRTSFLLIPAYSRIRHFFLHVVHFLCSLTIKGFVEIPYSLIHARVNKICSFSS